MGEGEGDDASLAVHSLKGGGQITLLEASIA